jgi:hypothetical protein
LSPIAKPTNELLDAKRKLGDPVADAVVADLIAGGHIDEVDRDLLSLLRNDQELPPNLPQSLHDYLEITKGPVAVSADALLRGQNVYIDYGPEILMVLGFYSLPAAYAARKGVQVLYRTAFLEKRPMRRVLETSRMVTQVLDPKGLSPSGSGIRTIQKVRLMHAGIRHMILADEESRWDTEELGIPINQEDLAGTLMTFSFIVLAGLKQLHIEVPPADAEGYVQTWSGIGKLMGVDDDLLPDTFEEARELTFLIRKRQIAGSPEGIALTRALVDGYAEWLDRIPNGVPASAVHFFLDDDILMHQNVAALLEVPHASIFLMLPRLILDLGRAFKFLIGHGRFQARMMRWLSRHTVAALMNGSRDARYATFSIPDHLHDDWDLPVPGARV